MNKLGSVSAAVLIAFSATLAAQTPPASDCAEVFVQDYEYDDGGAVFRNMTPCPGDNLQGSPAFPVQQKLVHKEYDHGDFYVMQISNEWHWELSARPDCVHISRRVTRHFRRVEGQVDESAVSNFEGVKRSRETGERYASSIIAGNGAKARVPRNAPGSRLESTRFGIQCLRSDGSSALAALMDGCLPILPAPKCKAELHLMPIELKHLTQDGLGARGRTTRLELLPNATRLDRTTWVMP
jgi:hypothetical protein